MTGISSTRTVTLKLVDPSPWPSGSSVLSNTSFRGWFAKAAETIQLNDAVPSTPSNDAPVSATLD